MNRWYASGIGVLSALICFFVLLLANSEASPPSLYTIVDLGPLGHPAAASPSAQAFAINPAGTVVGATTTISAIFDSFIVDHENRVRLLPGFSQSPNQALGINQTRVVGYASIDQGDRGGVMRRPVMMACPDARPVVDCDRSMTVYEIPVFRDLPLISSYGEARAINSRNHVVGFQIGLVSAPEALRYRLGEQMQAERAFLYREDKGTIDLGILVGSTGAASTAWAINDEDVVVGTSQITPGMSHAFAWNGQMWDLGTLGGPESFGFGLNAQNWVVGTSTPYARFDFFHAFVAEPRRRDGTDWRMRDLGSLLGSRFQSAAYAINAAKQIVGWSDATIEFFEAGTSLLRRTVVERHAMFYHQDRMYDLNNYAPTDRNWVLQEARAINDRGQIAGFGTLDGEIHGFRLDPI